MEKAPGGETLKGIAILAFQRGALTGILEGGGKKAKEEWIRFYRSHLCK